jgi:2Fe-2S iron-sulfur cluster binding domain
MPDVGIRVTVNRQLREASVEPRLTLADFLRERCQLTGTHLGCDHGVCGACTVLLDGAAVRACLVFAVQADGAEVTTIEGLGPGGRRPFGGAAGVPRLSRAAVRVLHARLRGVGDRLPARQPRPDR